MVQTRSSKRHISRLPMKILRMILEELQYPDWKDLRTTNRLFNILLPVSNLVERKKDRLEHFALIEAAYYSQQRLGTPLAEEHPDVAMGIADAALPCYGCFGILPLKMFYLREHTFEYGPGYQFADTDWRDEFRQVDGRWHEQVDKSMFRTLRTQFPRKCVRCALEHYSADVIEWLQRPYLQRPYADPTTDFWGFCETHGKETKWHLLSSFKMTDRVRTPGRTLMKGGCLCLLPVALLPLRQDIRRLAEALRAAQGCSESPQKL